MALALWSTMTKIEVKVSEIESKIFLIRGEKILLGPDLAEVYEVPTKRLSEQVRRNLRRFPLDFMFILTDQEFRNLKSQFATSSSEWGGSRKPPMAFTEQGVAMLSTVLNSDRAIEVNIAIMRAFVRLRKVLILDKEFENRIAQIERKYDGRFKVVFEAIRELISTRSVPRKRIIGLGEPDT
ncbi:ORF6N domain-containing protein [Bdellovibrionota bacterium FG-1]